MQIQKQSELLTMSSVHTTRGFSELHPPNNSHNKPALTQQASGACHGSQPSLQNDKCHCSSCYCLIACVSWVLCCVLCCVQAVQQKRRQPSSSTATAPASKRSAIIIDKPVMHLALDKLASDKHYHHDQPFMHVKPASLHMHWTHSTDIPRQVAIITQQKH